MNAFNEFFVLAGPCVIESEALVMTCAESLKEISDSLGLSIVFKASFDKANRSSHQSFRGLGRESGLRILEKVKKTFDLPVVTDVHEVSGLDEIADVVDVLQTPAFLCRQTDFIQAVARCNKPVNIKKGQFLSPQEMQWVIEKARAVTQAPIFACERGSSFGYNNLVVDFRGLAIMRNFAPVVFDATHSVQLPGGGKGCSGGQREFVPVLARAAIAAGIDGLFLETHPDPDNALSDGPNSWPLHQLKTLLSELLSVRKTMEGTEKWSV